MKQAVNAAFYFMESYPRHFKVSDRFTVETRLLKNWSESTLPTETFYCCFFSLKPSDSSRFAKASVCRRIPLCLSGTYSAYWSSKLLSSKYFIVGAPNVIRRCCYSCFYIGYWNAVSTCVKWLSYTCCFYLFQALALVFFVFLLSGGHFFIDKTWSMVVMLTCVRCKIKLSHGKSGFSQAPQQLKKWTEHSRCLRPWTPKTDNWCQKLRPGLRNFVYKQLHAKIVHLLTGYLLCDIVTLQAYFFKYGRAVFMLS